MKDYTKLVEALRSCDEYAFCNDCPIFETCDGDVDKAMAIAADAIEATDRLLDQNTQRCEELRKQLREAHESYERHLNELEAQLPKRGKWKITTEHFTPELICSECGVHIPCVAGWCMDAHMNYCPNCGAKMEAQE